MSDIRTTRKADPETLFKLKKIIEPRFLEDSNDLDEIKCSLDEDAVDTAIYKEVLALSEEQIKDLLTFDIDSDEDLYELSDRDKFIYNIYHQEIRGVGKNRFSLNEHLAEGKSELSYPTLYDYDKEDFFYQENARAEHSEYKAKTEYQLSCGIGIWIRFFNHEDYFTYGTICTAGQHILWKLEESNIIEELIPYEFVKGKHHGKEEGKGCFRWDYRKDANGREAELKELQARSSKYLSEIFERLSSEFLADQEPKAYILERYNEEYDPYMVVVLNNNESASRIRFTNFIDDINALRSPTEAFEATVQCEIEAYESYIKAQLKDIEENFIPSGQESRESEVLMSASVKKQFDD